HEPRESRIGLRGEVEVARIAARCGRALGGTPGLALAGRERAAPRVDPARDAEHEAHDGEDGEARVPRARMSFRYRGERARPVVLGRQRGERMTQRVEPVPRLRDDDARALVAARKRDLELLEAEDEAV